MTSPEDPGAAEAAGDAEARVDLPDKLFFRIGEAAELVGVEPHVLRYWESEFRMRPQRSASGQRMYRRTDIARFLKIRRLLHDEGFTIAGARKAMDEPGAPSEAPTSTSVDSGRILQVLDRLAATRLRLGELVARVRGSGAGSSS